MKSGSTSKPRLKRTLKRKPSFRTFTEDDIKYLWAANPSEDKKVFREKALGYLATRNLAWVMEAPTKKGMFPVGIITGVYAGPMVMLGDATWFPWASERNKVESMVNILNELRKTILYIFYCTLSDKKFYEYIAKHGILRRIGHYHGIYENEPAILWQHKEWPH